MAEPDNWIALGFEARQIFSPSAPIDEQELFAGRETELRKLIDTILERGKHAIIFGERGVGKTSLAQVLKFAFPSLTQSITVTREQADPSDDFSSLWKKVFKDFTVQYRQKGGVYSGPLADLYEGGISPDDVRRELSGFFLASNIPVVVIDEFDKLTDSTARRLTANLIKSMSDYSINVTLCIIGVADDIGELLGEHESISRCVEQIPMPRMSSTESREIIQKRIARLGVKITPDALGKIVTLSRGLPSYVHLLGLYSVLSAADAKKKTISDTHVDSAIRRAIEQSQESIHSEYAMAIHTNRSDTLFREVLLACALAQTDERGLFTPNNVIQPLSSVLGRQVQISNFQNHLKKFISNERARILTRRGKERAYKFRFRDPMMQPFIIMKGVEDGMIDPAALDALSFPAEPRRPI